MATSIGIVGLPNVGKSTLFQAITKKKVDTSNYPFCTIDPNVGIVKVPDERLNKLAEFFKSAKVIPTIIEFVDIAGLVKGANKGEGLGNKFLSHIREVDAILQVVRCFENANITHVDETVDPLRDLETINTELILKDLETVEKRIAALEKEARARKKEAVIAQQILRELQKVLNQGKTAHRFIREHPHAENVTAPLFLLSAKPIVYLLNADSEKQAASAIKRAKELDVSYVVMNVRDEADAADLSPEEIKEFGLAQAKFPELIKKAYETLKLITFFTTGPDETRAWTVTKGTQAPQAGAVIHSDFEEKFIRAAVIRWDKLLEAGGLAEAMAKGLIRTEGKEYVVKDGDVIEFKHG